MRSSAGVRIADARSHAIRRPPALIAKMTAAKPGAQVAHVGRTKQM
ncbi:hypothetical protein D8I24_4450 [Cupriavidus necator H850]|nr:hypothetical protein D8I24_4450 [Cupriavidus necator H850]